MIKFEMTREKVSNNNIFLIFLFQEQDYSHVYHNDSARQNYKAFYEQYEDLVATAGASTFIVAPRLLWKIQSPLLNFDLIISVESNHYNESLLPSTRVTID